MIEADARRVSFVVGYAPYVAAGVATGESLAFVPLAGPVAGLTWIGRRDELGAGWQLGGLLFAVPGLILQAGGIWEMIDCHRDVPVADGPLPRISSVAPIVSDRTIGLGLSGTF
jgi:hypothetical protein